jgi:TnpA family transposase
MRFVVPVPSVYARPNPKYFGRRGGATWLNMINDQAAGLGGKVVAGTPRDSLYVLDLVLNAMVLFTTRYMDAAVTQLRADGFDVRDEDVARLSPFVRHHINVLGRYSFQLPDLPGGLRPLRDKHATDDE